MKNNLYSYRKKAYPYESEKDYLKKFRDISLPSWITDSNFMCIECYQSFKYSDIECKKCSKNTYLSLNIGIGLLIEFRDSSGILKLGDMDEEAKEEIIEKTIVEALPIVLEENDALPKMYRKDGKTFIDKQLCYKLIDFYIGEHNKLVTKKPVIIDKISVRKLFGYHSYDICFNGSDDINIIYGSNAIGKTTILKIIELFFVDPLASINVEIRQSKFVSKQYCISKEKKELLLISNYLYKIPFNRITIYLSNGNYLDIKKVRRDDKIIITAFGFTIEIYKDKYEKELKELFKIIKSNLQSLYLGKRFLFIKLSEHQTANYYTNSFNKLLADFVSHNLADNEKYDYEPEYALEYGAKLLSFWRKNSNLVYNIVNEFFDTFANNKNETINRVQFIKGKIARTNLSDDEKTMLYYFVKLQFTFNSVVMKWTIQNYNDETRHIFSKFIYFSSIFYSFYYEKDPSQKFIDYDKKENRIIIRAKKTLGDERFKSILSFDDLSSGEKRIFDLLFNLIMNTTRETIVLIDEPEVSLHTEWQMQFSDIVKEIKKVYDFAQVIVASHSPFITSGHDEYIVSPSLKKVKNYE